MIYWDNDRQQFVAIVNGRFVGACGYHQGQSVLDDWLKKMADQIAKGQ